MKNKVEEKFTEFYENWITQLEDYLQQLRNLSTQHRCSKNDNLEQQLQALVTKVTQHYKEYYTVKWALAVEDVLPFFHPVWSTPLENAYSWVTGWKPSAVFKLLDSVRSTQVLGPGLAELTPEQLRKIQLLRGKVRAEKQKVEMEMERQQVAVAERKMVELSRLSFRIKNGSDQASEIEQLVKIALNGVLGGLVKVMKMADCVRLRTMKGTLDILNPLQSVDFLAMISMLQIQIRQAGKKKDSMHHFNI